MESDASVHDVNEAEWNRSKFETYLTSNEGFLDSRFHVTDEI